MYTVKNFLVVIASLLHVFGWVVTVMGEENKKTQYIGAALVVASLIIFAVLTIMGVAYVQ